MKKEDKDLEQKINSAFEKVTPNNFEAILNDCKNQSNERKVISMTSAENKKNKQNKQNLAKQIIAIAAAFVLLFVGIGTVAMQNRVGVSTVNLDVNPGIEIELNKADKVVKVVPLNDDAKKVIGDMDFKGSDLNVTVNALVGSMLKNGYLSEIANSILVSVDGKDAAKTSELQAKISKEIETTLKNNNIDPAILTQKINATEEEKAIADELNISIGKAQFISKILQATNKYTAKDLAKLTINELNLLSEQVKAELKDVTTSGNASQKGYIGKGNAQAIALKNMGLSKDAVKNLHVEVDMEKGQLTYEVEFVNPADNLEYEYKIDAKTGEIILVENEPFDPNDVDDNDLDDDDDDLDDEDDLDDQDDDDLDDEDDLDDQDDDDLDDDDDD